MDTPQQPTDHKEEQDALHLQEPPDIRPIDATRFAPKLPVSPPVAQQAHGTSPYYVQEDDDDHAVRRVAMHVSEQQPEVDQRVEVLHVLIRHAGGGPVIEHQQDARDGQQQEQEKR